MDKGQRRYAAFLSYSHKDAAVARRLHQRLESYRLPRRLVGTDGEHGPVPARLVPIFRDREELPAAGDLSEKVRAALAASDALVILCSPAAAASLWVAKEIDTFRSLHPDRPVIAAILEGEPGEAFPANLAAAGAEPLAADLRPGRDGHRLGLLKLVAGLSGIPLDALVQRDAQRRLRRVTAVTGVALAAVVAMAVLTAVAFQARREAQRQRAEAEGLVEFMLTDLRDRLRGVGRLDVMQAVNARALGYYGDRSEVGGLSDESLSRRARILQAIGDDALERDDLASAFTAYRQASAITRQQLARHPGDPRRLVGHGKTEFGLGRIKELRGEWAAAARHYRTFAEAADGAVRSAPKDSEYLGEAASAAIDLGNIAAAEQDYSVAGHFYAKAVATLERANRLKPDDVHFQLSLANAHAWLADTYYNRGLWKPSLEERQRQFAITSTMLTKQPKNAEGAFRQAAAERGLACSLWKTGRQAEAKLWLARSDQRSRVLVRLDPDNAQWKLLKRKLTADLRGANTSWNSDSGAANPAPPGAGGKVKGCTVSPPTTIEGMQRTRTNNQQE